MKKKLSANQIYCIQVLQKYDCMIMYDGYVTGGYGVRINRKTIDALERLGIIYNGRLTELGKSVDVMFNSEQNPEATDTPVAQ